MAGRARDGGTVAPRVAAPEPGEHVDVPGERLAAGGPTAGLRFVGGELAGRSLRGALLEACELSAAHLGGADPTATADLTGSRWADVRVTRLDGAVLRCPRAAWRRVAVEDTRIGSTELSGGALDSVAFRRCRLRFVELRDATVTDLVVADCDIDELDLSDARATRVALPGTRVRSLRVRNAVLRDVDLRGAALAEVDAVAGLAGATLTAGQLLDLAPLFAVHHRIRVDG